MRQIIRWTGWALIALVAAIAIPALLKAQGSSIARDTTVYTATRIRTASDGTVTSISMANVAPPKTDTVRIAGPRDSIAFYPRVVSNPWHFTFDVVNWTGAGTKPADVAFPSLPSPQPIVVHDTVIQVRVDTVKVPAVIPDSVQVVHVDTHIFVYSTGVPNGYGVYLETGTQFLGSVNASPTGWQAWQTIKSTVNAQGYPAVTPPRLLGSLYPTQDAAALALYQQCCPAKP